jgi:hypothetical protein
MAIIYNPLLGEISGKFATGVFKQLGGQTILCSLPLKGNKKCTPEQKVHRDIWKVALKETRKILSDPVKRAAYEAKRKPGLSAHNIVMRELTKGKS